MNLTHLIKTRRTIRQYKNRKVPKRLLYKILDSARWAPSLHNRQPWKFVIPEGEARKKLIDALKRSRDKEALLIRLTLRENIKVIEHAPVVILVYNDSALSNRVKKGGKLYSDYLDKSITFEIQSVACAIQNMLLTAYSLGLGTAWFGMPVFAEKFINKFLHVEYKLMAILTVGYPAESPRRPGRKPLSEIVDFVK